MMSALRQVTSKHLGDMEAVQKVKVALKDAWRRRAGVPAWAEAPK